MKDTPDMDEDNDWPGQQPGDAGAFTVVGDLLAGDNPSKLYAIFPPACRRRWHAIVGELFEAQREGGHAGRSSATCRLSIADRVCPAHGQPRPARAYGAVAARGASWSYRPTARRTRAAADAPHASGAAPGSSRRTGRPGAAGPAITTARAAERHAVREEQVYAALRELGEATVAALARHTGQDRGSVHRRVQKLLEQEERNAASPRTPSRTVCAAPPGVETSD